MCGISGGITTSALSSTEISRIRDLWFMNSSRGIDGSGLFDFKPGAEIKAHFFKSPRPSYLNAHPKFYDYLVEKGGMWEKNKPVLIATHARAATKGVINKENAHPFLSSDGNVLGTHNGTITGSYPKAKDFETDSEALIETIAELGFEEAIKKFSKDATNFAAALAVLDRRDDTFWLYRNTQRPLHMCYYSTTLYYSSAARDLQYVLDSLTKPLVTPEFKEDKFTLPYNDVFALPANRFLKFKVGSSISSVDTGLIPEPTKSYGYTSYQRREGGVWANENFPERRSSGPTKSLGANPTVIPSHMQDPSETTVNYLGSNYLSTNSDMFYAPEFGKYFSETTFVAVLIWRVKNYDKFQEMFKEAWEDCTTEDEKKKFIHESGFSKNLIKKILRKGGQKYLRSCVGTVLHRERDSNWAFNKFAEVAIGQKVFKVVADFLRTSSVKPTVKKEQPASNVIPLPAPKEISYGHKMQYSVGSFQELYKIYDCGCTFCSEKQGLQENLFFLSNTSYLCEVCQQTSMELLQHNQPTGLTYTQIEELKDYYDLWQKNVFYYRDLSNEENKVVLN